MGRLLPHSIHQKLADHHERRCRREHGGREVPLRRCVTTPCTTCPFSFAARRVVFHLSPPPCKHSSVRDRQHDQAHGPHPLPHVRLPHPVQGPDHPHGAVRRTVAPCFFCSYIIQPWKYTVKKPSNALLLWIELEDPLDVCVPPPLFTHLSMACLSVGTVRELRWPGRGVGGS